MERPAVAGAGSADRLELMLHDVAADRPTEGTSLQVGVAEVGADEDSRPIDVLDRVVKPAVRARPSQSVDLPIPASPWRTIARGSSVGRSRIASPVIAAQATPGRRHTDPSVTALTVSFMRLLSSVIPMPKPRLSDVRRPADLLHPVRMRVVLALAGGQPMTVQELAERLGDVPIATLYRHVRTLAEAGILVTAGERQVRGTVERSYTLDRDRAGISPADLATPS
jgi:DNA-binding transcriptional ArsR family regulator